jgi:hypothetical protein
MIRAKRSHRLVLIAFSAATIFSYPVHAQTAAPSPEALADAALQADSGVALARRQISDADLLGAAGTLERVLLTHPEAAEARLLYASLLCRLDDAEGAAVELRLLPPEAITDAGWGEVTEACGPIPRPAPTTAPEGGSRP